MVLYWHSNESLLVDIVVLWPFNLLPDLVAVSFQVSCSGMYVNDGSLAISCTSPQEITSIEYMLNRGSSVIGQCS